MGNSGPAFALTHCWALGSSFCALSLSFLPGLRIGGRHSVLCPNSSHRTTLATMP